MWLGLRLVVGFGVGVVVVCAVVVVGAAFVVEEVGVVCICM